MRVCATTSFVELTGIAGRAVEELEGEIEAKLLRLALPGIRIDPDQVRRVTSALVEQTLRTAVSAPPRRLSTADLYRSIQGVTHTQILTSDLNALIGMAMGQGGGTHRLAVIHSSSWLFALDAMRTPAPEGILARSPSVDVLGRLLASMRFVAMSTSLVSVRGLKGSTIARTPVPFPVMTLPRTMTLSELTI
jgi:hypothetical protein